MISAPITTTKVGNELGVSSRNVGVLCTSNNINKYSKFKPYSYATTQSLYGSSGNDTSKIESIDFGMILKYPTVRSTEQLTGSLLWTQWSPPKGGESSPFRIGDFRGYDHNNKVRHIRSVSMHNSDNQSSHIPTIGNPDFPEHNSYYTAKIEFDNSASLKINDFPDLRNYYLTVIVGANVNGLNGGEECIFGQSSDTVQQFFEKNKSGIVIWEVSVNTTNAEEMLKLNNGKNICAVGFAPKTNSGILPKFVSISMWDESLKSIYYNDKYGMYGDGGEGGNPPQFVSYGHMNLKTTTPANAFNISKSANSVDITYSLGYPQFIMTSGQVGSGFNLDLVLSIKANLIGGGSSQKFELTAPFTETKLITTNTQSEYFTEGSPESGFLGIKLDRSYFTSNGNWQFEIVVQTRTRAIAAQNISLRSDGQGNGIQTEMFTKTYNINF